jgi:hypothetical protein
MVAEKANAASRGDIVLLEHAGPKAIILVTTLMIDAGDEWQDTGLPLRFF